MIQTVRLVVAVALVAGSLLLAPAASATPVCTDQVAASDGSPGGPPRAVCGNRIFPESYLAHSYIQYDPHPVTGQREFQSGIEYLAELYPRWISVFTLQELYDDEDAVSAGPDEIRPYVEGDTGDGRDIWVIKITDHEAPDEGKQTLLFSLSVHGNEAGGREGGVRTAEDLAMAAEANGTITDGVDNYESTTGVDPEFHDLPVRDLLAQQAVYLIDFNIDGWVAGDLARGPGGSFTRGNSFGTDLNRQMPTVGRINASRNPLEESEMLYGHKFMHEVAAAGVDGLMAYGADVHGETTSNAYVDIMYPAGQFDSVDHRRLMAIAERTKSVIDDTLFLGISNQIEEQTADGNNGDPSGTGYTPQKPARWATVWDTLGYTDTGFIGDYLATDLGVTGMDYEIWLNHSTPGNKWTVYLQENHINATRAIIKTAMAYALYQEDEFNADNLTIPTGGGVPGYVFNPDTVTDTDENGAGTLPGPNPSESPGIGRNGLPVEQRSYEATNMQWFDDTSPLLEQPFTQLTSGQIASDSTALDAVDTLVLADVPLPADPSQMPVDPGAYYANLKAWVESGGNLVLTDKALHALDDLGVVTSDQVTDINVYQPYANIEDFEHPMVARLRLNARQLAEYTLIGYGIGNNQSPMTVVDRAAWEAASGYTVATTASGSGGSDNGTLTSVGEAPLGEGKIRILGGGLGMPTEQNDHRYGLRDYALTYTGLFILENSMNHDTDSLGVVAEPSTLSDVFMLFALVPLAGFALRRRR